MPVLTLFLFFASLIFTQAQPGWLKTLPSRSTASSAAVEQISLTRTGKLPFQLGDSSAAAGKFFRRFGAKGRARKKELRTMLKSAEERPSTAERTFAPIRARAKNGAKKLETLLASYQNAVRMVYLLQFRIHSLARPHRTSKAQFQAVRDQLITQSVVAFGRGRMYLRFAKVLRPDIKALRHISRRDFRVAEDDVIVTSFERTEAAFKLICMPRKAQSLEKVFAMANKQGVPLQNPSAAAAVLDDPNLFSQEHANRLREDKNFRKLTLKQQMTTMRKEQAAARVQRKAAAKQRASERQQNGKRKNSGQQQSSEEQQASKKQRPHDLGQRRVSEEARDSDQQRDLKKQRVSDKS